MKHAFQHAFQKCGMRLSDRIHGACIRRVSEEATSARNALFLSFDDGPDPEGTPRVLELLAEYGAKATFFLIGERARKHPELVREIRRRGHSIGNHSPDHRYSPYFGREDRLREWIVEGERMLSEISGSATIGFRPPAGVRTPALVRAVRSLGVPLILWQTRFYDSVFPLDRKVFVDSLAAAKPGDILLLHDAQKKENLDVFLSSLRAYLEGAKGKSFQFHSLKREHFHDFRSEG